MRTALVQSFSANKLGRDIAVGDIHGYFTKLQEALDRFGFNPAVDRLFSVGDLVDRGPESGLAIEWLEKPWFHAVQGNHEDMAIYWAAGRLDAANYVINGGAWNVGNTPQERMAFADAFSVLPIAIQVETAGGMVGIVHADCPLPTWRQFVSALDIGGTDTIELGQLIAMAQWSRHRCDSLFDDGVPDVRAVIVGHTPVPRWTSLGNVIFIDTGAWLPPEHGGGDFTLLDLATLQPLKATPVEQEATSL